MQIAAALLAWAERHGRHDLPWQLERTPYRVWVSEIMLQQTQVATVLSYYQRFMQRLPSVAHLAAAPIDEVLHLWSGLGYYARARHLHQAAQRVLRDHGGELPSDPEQLMQLPGIGRSTAAAIVALAHGRRATILDGNVKRVMTRLFAVEGVTGAAATEQRLWECAERCTPEDSAAAYTQAIMDLGALVCTRSGPLCQQCPLSMHCLAYRAGRTQELPRPRPRAARPLRRAVLLVVQRADGAVLLYRRASRGVWAGLWTPPEFTDLAQARDYAERELRGAQIDAMPQSPLRHRFTHFDFEMTPLRARCESLRPRVGEERAALWYHAEDKARIGLPASIAMLLREIEREELLPLAAPGT
jgi:A/G-specific adenine glycosylase